MILETGIKNVELINDGEFNSFALTNGKLKKDCKLIVYISSDEYISHIAKNVEIKCVLCTKDIYEKLKIRNIDILSKLGIVITDNPRTSFFLFHNYLNRHTDFYKNDFENKIDDTAQIHSTCVLPEKNIVIGKNVILHPNVVLYENVWIGDNVTIGDGSVIGSPAFYYFDIDGKKAPVDSTGGVKIKENVEIHSHVVICRGTLGGMTEICCNTKIDSHVFLGHDVTINKNCLIPAGSIFAGGVTLNENCFVGIGSKIAPLITIGKNVMISAGSTVVKNVKDNNHVSGNFAIEHVKHVNFIRKISKDKI
jgi:UDP-3-O-[3-hydroxymyristoyl] glucosamine N-acyltransferase